ncbi:MAG: hypothetical protein WC997_02485 [Porticoccaceae bacterium]
MSKLGLGLAAVQGVFDEREARKSREYVQARRDAELSNLEARTAAERSGYELSDARNQGDLSLVDKTIEGKRKELALLEAQRDGDLSLVGAKTEGQREQLALDSQKRKAATTLLPGQTQEAQSRSALNTARNQGDLSLVSGHTANAKKAQQLQGLGLDASIERQPLEQQILHNKAEVERALSQHDVEDLPRAIAEKKQQGVFSEMDAGSVAIYKLSELIDQGDSQRVITFMNAMIDAGNVKGATEKVATVSVEQDPATGGNVFVARGASGKDVMRMSQEQMLRVRSQIGTVSLEKVNAGQDLVSIGRDGTATLVHSGQPKESDKPGLQRSVEYLVRDHGMTQAQALDVIKNGTTREKFVEKAAQAIISLGQQPTAAQIEGFNATYDTLYPGQAQAEPQIDAGTAAPTTDWNSWITQ